MRVVVLVMVIELISGSLSGLKINLLGIYFPIFLQKKNFMML
jgi:hypothetical protein